MSRLWLSLISAAVYLLAWAMFSALEPRQEKGQFPIDPPTPFRHYLPETPSRGRLLVVHGIAVSKSSMRLISSALADAGFDVYAIDLPGHGESPVSFDAILAGQAIRQAKDQLGTDTTVLGHSLGGGLLLDLAATDRFSTIVLLAPAPTPTAEIHADRILIVQGSLDLPAFIKFAPQVADIGGERAELHFLPWGGHSAAILNSSYVRDTVEWIAGEQGPSRTAALQGLTIVMLISGIAFGVCLLPGRRINSPPLPVRLTTLLVRYSAACGIALLILKVVNPLDWLHAFGMNYLTGFVFLTGLILWIQKPQALPADRGALLKALAAAVFVIVVLGFGAASTVFHMGLGSGRWWRFPFMAMASFPLFAFDELNLRRMPSRWKSAAAAVLTRMLLWSFLVTGVLLLNRENAYLVMIAHLIVLLWLALGLAAGVIRRNTQDPAAAALFSSIVSGWVLAALFIKL